MCRFELSEQNGNTTHIDPEPPILKGRVWRLSRAMSEQYDSVVSLCSALTL